MEDRISLEIHEGVAELRLNRPDKMNALDPAMFAALAAAGERLKTEAGLRAVVLSGAGRAFCAGLDMSSFSGASLAQSPLTAMLVGGRTAAGANPLQQAMMVWREVPVPVVAAIQGAALGGGLQLALACDLRFVGKDAALSVMEIRWGLVPDLGGMALLRGLVRDDVARDLVWTGRTVKADEALALGLATRVCADPRAAALAYARQIAGGSPDAIRAGKRLLNLAADADLREILLQESREQEALLGAPNQAEAVMANLQKRPPDFSDR